MIHGSARRLPRGLLACIVILLGFFWADSAHAYTWMIRHGYQACGACHADPAGGETLSAYGRVQGDLLLRFTFGGDDPKPAAAEPATDTSDDDDDFGDFEDDEEEEEDIEDEDEDEEEGAAREPSDLAGFLWGLVAPQDVTPFWGGNTPQLLLGGSWRFAALHKIDLNETRAFPMQADIYGQFKVGPLRLGGSLGVARVPEGSPHARAAQVTTAQGESMNLISRTHYLGYDVSQTVLVRAGRLNLPFGIRIPEHTMWVREATQTDRESDQQHGVAVSYAGEALRLELMGIAGNYQVNPDEYRERGGAGFLEYLITEGVAVGGQGLYTSAEADRVLGEISQTTRQAYGLNARVVPVHEVVVLAEGNALLRSRRDTGYVGFLQVWYEAVPGLHFGATGETLDEGIPKEPGVDEVKPRYGGWASVNWFFWHHFDVRLDGIYRDNDETSVLLQMHAYL